MSTEQPLFPPAALCVCGCTGAQHAVVWDGDTFVGTRCAEHGGHKFAFAAPTDLPEIRRLLA